MHARMIDAWMHACCVRVIYCRSSMHAISREAVTVLAAACACAWICEILVLGFDSAGLVSDSVGCT